MREDLIDLYRLSERLGIGSVRTIGHDRLELDLLHNKQGYEMTQQQLLGPLREYQTQIRLITQMISANYGAHG